MYRIFFTFALLILPNLTFAFGLGTVSEEVKTLQAALNKAGYTVTNYGAETTYFGPQTEAALINYQIDNAADILGGLGVLNNLGTLDPLTKAHLFGKETVLGLSLTPFTTNLTVGMKHPDVQRLQQFLNEGGYPIAFSGPGSKGQETTYYGPATAAAVKRYQEANRAAILTPNNLTVGTGHFLTATRNHLNNLLKTTGTTKTITRTNTIKSSNTTHTLAVRRVGRGSVTTSTGLTCSTPTCAFVFARDTKVTLTATPLSGDTFSRWSGSCTGTKKTCTVLMSKSKSVTANFKSKSSSGGGGGGGSSTSASTPSLTTYTLTAAVSGQGSITGTGISCGSDCTEAYTSGTSVTLTATPNSGNTFAGWSGSCSGTQTTCTVSMTQAKTASASFSLIVVTTPTNGTCGTANGMTIASAPTTNLCSVGTASSVSGSGPWSWTCAGSNGGTTASCSATQTEVSGGGMSVSLVPTRTTGTAPLAVLFDSTGTTLSGVDTFREVSYAYNFGDTNSGTWAVSGQSKNTQTGGPIAAHVFDTPGTYTVTVTGTRGGSSAQAQTTITVADPNTVYAGTNTICVSLTADFTGCPSGATHQATLPSGTGWNGKRVLLHRGQDFTALGAISIRDGNAGVQVGAFGSGAKPIVYSIGVGDWRPETTNFAEDVTVMDLATFGKIAQNVGKRVLFLRNDMSNPRDSDSYLSFGDGYWGLDDPWRSVPSSSFYNPRELFFVENTSVGNGTIAVNAIGYAAYSAWMGNVFGPNGGHNLRIGRSFKGFIAHNRLIGISNDGNRHALKFHSGGLGTYSDSMVTSGYTWASRYNIIANNEFGSAADNNGWIIAVSPQDDIRAEGIEDVILENNRFVRGIKEYQEDFVLTARRGTYRGNTRVDGGIMSYRFDQHAGGLPAEWKGPYYTEN